MDYMQEKAKNGFDRDPFLLMTSREHERHMLSSFGLLTPEQAQALPPALDFARPTLPGVGRTARLRAAERRARYLNVLSALLGGLALIVPMIIMKLVPTIACVLITTCGFVISFALAIALLSALRPSEILAVTAGYAAVLVVFVGTTTH